MAVSGYATPAGPGAEAPLSLIGEQTASSLLANVVRVYRRHVGVMLVCSVLPVLPFLLLMEMLEGSAWALLPMAGYLVGLFLGSGALTVAVSDICLGNRPTLRRAFVRITSGGRWHQLLTTGSLLTLGFYLGLVLLVVPGVWLLVRGLFTSIIVTLEGRRNIDAIKRSLALTKGQAWRLTGLTLVPAILLYLLLLLLAVAAGLLLGLLAPASPLNEHLIKVIVYAASFGVLTPMMGITMVLLYYDQRARREAYDVRELAEDLMR